MKKAIAHIITFIVFLGVSTCAPNPTQEGTGWDKYFLDEEPGMINNILVTYSLDEEPDKIEYNEVVGITNIEYVTYQGESEIAISLRKIVDMKPTGNFKGDPYEIVLTQGKPFSNGEEPKFRYKGSYNIKKNNKYKEIIVDINQIIYYPNFYMIFKGLTPTIIRYDVFENQILRNVSYEDEQFLLSLYQHGNAPQQIEAYRFENFIIDEIDGDDKTFMELAYKKERPTARWYDLQNDVDTERVLDVLSTIENSILYNLDYRYNYIRKWDYVEQPENEDGSWSFAGMSKSDWQRCMDIFYEIDYIPSLELTMYFEPVAKNEDTGETRTFDPYKPFTFRLSDDSSSPSYEFVDVEVVKGEVDGYRD